VDVNNKRLDPTSDPEPNREKPYKVKTEPKRCGLEELQNAILQIGLNCVQISPAKPIR